MIVYLLCQPLNILAVHPYASTCLRVMVMVMIYLLQNVLSVLTVLQNTCSRFRMMVITYLLQHV